MLLTTVVLKVAIISFSRNLACDTASTNLFNDHTIFIDLSNFYASISGVATLVLCFLYQVIGQSYTHLTNPVPSLYTGRI